MRLVFGISALSFLSLFVNMLVNQVIQALAQRLKSSGYFRNRDRLDAQAPSFIQGTFAKRSDSYDQVSLFFLSQLLALLRIHILEEAQVVL